MPRGLQAAFGFALMVVRCLAQDWQALDRQAENAYTRGDLKEAVRVAKLAADAAGGPKQSAQSLDRLGFFEYTAGNRKDGELHLRAALELRATRVGRETEDYAASANDLALFCRDTAKLPEAYSLATEAVDLRSRLLGPTDLRVAESLNVLGSVVALQGDYDAAIRDFERALTIHEKQTSHMDSGEEFGTLCVNLAGTYQRVGKYGKAEATFEKGLVVLRQHPGVNHPAYAASLVASAYLQADLGHYSAAEKLYDEGGRLLREQLGEQHPYYATFLNNRAALYLALGNITVAEADYRKSLELKRKIYGPDALTIGASLRNLARLVIARNPAEGEKLFEQAADLYAHNPKPPPFDYTSALLGLAEARRDRGDLAGAREALARAAETASKGLGEKHPLYAAVLRDRALVHQSAHEYREAEVQLQDAIHIVEQAQGEEHPDLARYLQSLAGVHVQAGDYRAAEPLYRRAFEISNRALTAMLTIGSESSRVALLANGDDPIPALLAFQRKAGAVLPPARELAFEAVALRKGRVLEEVHAWGELLRAIPDRAVRARFQEHQDLLQCEASLTVAMGYRDLKPAVLGACTLPGTDLEGRYERLLHDLRTNWNTASDRQALAAVNVLRERIDSLEASLSRHLPQLAATVSLLRTSDLRARLQPGEALIELVESRHRYEAFLLDRAGPVRWADLGPAAPIDRAAQDLIAAANDWSIATAGIQPRSAEAARQTAGDAMSTLSQKLGPILSLVQGNREIRRLRVAPDGMLSLVPFGALTNAAGHFLIEQYAISYLPAGRELAGPAVQGRPLGPAVIALSPGGRASSGALQRLAAAELEAGDLRRLMPEANLLGEGQATEQALKQLHRPALLHIVGHGMIRGGEDCRDASVSPACRLSALDPAAQAMNLSAIVLEEAYGRGAGSRQDGLLTAVELESMDLQGSEMLVLSQCRMAGGMQSSGEGVYGMRRAAAIAGVRTFVAPLWNVSDTAERALMGRFYRELSTGHDRGESLRQAQLQGLRESRGGFLEWAPLILSGDAGPLPRELFR